MEGGPEDKKGGGVWMSGGGLAQDSGTISLSLKLSPLVTF